MEGNLAAYFRHQANSDQYGGGRDENYMSKEKDVIHHFPEEDSISSEYSDHHNDSLGPDITDIIYDDVVHHEGEDNDVNDSNDSCYEEPSTSSSSDEILEDHIEAMEQIRQLSIRSAEGGLRRVVKALNKDVSDENIWDVATSGDESDDNRAKKTYCDQFRDGNSHRRIKNNDKDGHYVENKKETSSMREKLTDRSIAVAEESLEVVCANKKSIFGLRNRAVLVDIALKRKKEEEEAQLAAEKTNMMRKKFKDALLEKALRSRNQSGDIVNDVVEVACKSEIQRGMIKCKTVGLRNSKSCALTLMEMEQQGKAEEDKKLQIAAIRRKFKAQHKNILLALMLKHKEGKKEESMNTDEEKKKKRKATGDNRTIARRVEVPLLVTESDEDAKNVRTIRFKGQVEGNKGLTLVPAPSSSSRGSGVAVGSGFASVRAHRAHTADTDVTPHR